MPTRISITGPFGISLVALALAALFFLFTIPSLLASVFAPGTGDADPSEVMGDLVARHEREMKTWKDRFNGRSAFFKPPHKYPPPPPPRPVVEPPKVDSTPPPPPDPIVYGGPSMIAIFGDEVWFRVPNNPNKSMSLGIGESDSDSTVKVISVNAPWSAKLEWKGKEFDVKFGPAIFEEASGNKFFTPLPKMNLPIPGLTVLPLPVSNEATTAPMPELQAETTAQPPRTLRQSSGDRLRARALEQQAAQQQPPQQQPTDAEKAKNQADEQPADDDDDEDEDDEDPDDPEPSEETEEPAPQPQQPPSPPPAQPQPQDQPQPRPQPAPPTKHGARAVLAPIRPT